MNFSFLLPSIKGIPVLMYHKVWPGKADALTITPELLQQQWEYLKKEGFKPLSLPEFLKYARYGNFPPKSLLITFDDGYRNNGAYVYPLLKQMGWCATFFIIADTLHAGDTTVDFTADAKMSVEELRGLDPDVVQLAMHGYSHEHFSRLDLEGIKKVMDMSVRAFEASGLHYHKVLAYPYGARPRDSETLKAMKHWFAETGIQAAFRIGNQVSRIPAPDIYEIRRIDIKGTDSMDDFRIKLRKGKLKPF